VFQPKRGRWRDLIVLLLLMGIVVIAKRRSGVFDWWIAIPSLLIMLVFAAYLAFFCWRVWVFLYEDRVEVEFAFTRLIREHFGIALSKRRAVFFRHVSALHKMRGFGGMNFLGIIGSTPTGEGRGVSFPYLLLEDYAELEAELLRRIPANCELYSTGFTARRGPFK